MASEAFGNGAFAFTSLTNVLIPSSVTNLGGDPFPGCPNLTAINVSAQNPNYGSLDGALFDKGQTTLIGFPGGLRAGYTIPNGVTSVGDSAFCNSQLTSVTIGNGVTSIGYSAFQNCGSLTTVTIPDSVTDFGAYAFSGCYNLSNAVVGNGVTNLREGAFMDCTNLTGVTIGSSVNFIGYFAFQNCESLTDVTIPDSVVSIAASAFADSGLTSVTIGSSVTFIDAFAFGHCVGLTTFLFAGSAPSAEPRAFTALDGGQLDPATVYYLPGTTGWSNTFAGLPTAQWFLPQPLILNNGPGFGVQSHQFGFTISWATNVSVVVEAATDPSNPVWVPIATNTLTGGTSHFSDPAWTNYPQRFYRLTSP